MIFCYKRGTGIGRLAKDLNLSICWPYEAKSRTRAKSVSINWGCLKLPTTANATVILNSNLSTAASKVEAFKALKEAGIRVPRWNKTLKSLADRLDPTAWIIARRDGLSKGKGMRLIKPEDRLTAIYEPDFFVEKLTCQREARIHVWGGRIICEQVKFLPAGCDNFIHNFENGARYSSATKIDRFFNEAQIAEARDFAIRSVEACGLHFGAVDILLTKKGTVYVLEVNTAPGLRADNTRLAYKNAIKQEFNL